MNEQRRRESKKQRLTREEKNANNKAWYKDQLDLFDRIALGNINRSSFSFSNSEGGVLFDATGRGSQYRRMKINHDLFNNIINKMDFEYITKPFGEEFGELPADFTNKDIISSKVKALIGLEMKRPFEWRVVATNDEATTRKEKEFFDGIKNWVNNSIMAPIQAQLEQQAMEESKGKELTGDEKRQIQEKIQEQMKVMTPPE